MLSFFAMPSSFRSPYLRLMRLHQPTGIWLLLWPCWWGMMLALPPASPIPWAYFLWFGLGAVVMRGAGCIINDMVDREVDANVIRTRSRPLASGELGMQQAGGWLLVLLALGLLCVLRLPNPVFWYALPSLALVVAYPFMKRVTWWPQAFLGITFNWGALLGFVAINGQLSASVGLLYLGCIFWTLGYDTIYGHQDALDDRRIGVKSTSLRLGSQTRTWLIGFYSIMLFCFAASLSLLPHPTSLSFWLGLAAMGGHLTWQIHALDVSSPSACLRLFKSNGWLGWLWLAPWIVAAAPNL